MELENLREAIDQIDSALVELLEKRLELVEEVAVYKASHGLPVLDSYREKALLAKIAKQVDKDSHQSTILATFSDIMNHSKRYQEVVIRQRSIADLAEGKG